MSSLVTRVEFGAGTIEALPDEIALIGAQRALLISTPGRSSLTTRVQTHLGDVVVETFSGAVVHVPEEIADAARAAAKRSGADVIVAVGGGSAIGVAKAVALTTSLSIVAIPTTYGGSEMTPIWGLTRKGRKETGRDARVQPTVVIYDPDLTLSLPSEVTAASGLNAVAHCIEALYAPDANAVSSNAAAEGLRLLNESLPLLAAAPEDRSQRERALKGAWRAGFALGTVQMGLHHKLCHTLGGSFDLPHAETHAVLIPYTAAYNRDDAADAMKLAATALGVEDAPTGVLSLAQSIPAPRSLREIGMKVQDLDRAADLAVEKQYPNPRPISRDAIRILLEAAFEGDSGYIAP